MGLKREERRLASRFYLDDPYDKVLLGKVDKMLADKEFRNLSELMRKGIELLYEDCYHMNSNSDVELLRMEVNYTAEEVANHLLEQLDHRMEVHDAKILGAIATCGGVGQSSITRKNEKNEIEEISMAVTTEEEKVPENLPKQTMSFLAGLNAD